MKSASKDKKVRERSKHVREQSRKVAADLHRAEYALALAKAAGTLPARPSKDLVLEIGRPICVHVVMTSPYAERLLKVLRTAAAAGDEADGASIRIDCPVEIDMSAEAMKKMITELELGIQVG